MVRRALVLTLAVAGLGCNAILGIDYGQPKPRTESDSGTPDASVTDAIAEEEAPFDASDASDTADADAGLDEVDPRCPVRWPSAPSTEDGPGDAGPSATGPDFELAAETLLLDVTPDLGFDLDGRCTCPDTTSCTPSSGRSDLQCDESGGRDIMANKFLESWVALGETALSQQSLQSDLSHGRAGTLLRIHNYNGLANDKLVILEFFGRAWIPPVGGVDRSTMLDGSDTWSVYTSSIVGVTTAIEQDIAAYVSNHVLVAKLVTATIALRPHTGANDNPLIVEFHDAVLTGTLVPTDRGFRIEDGQLAGRWPAHKALLALGALADSNGFLCGTHPFAMTLQAQVCANLDIMSERANDNTGDACDSMSIAIGFSAGPAHVGPAADPPIVPNNCPPDWNPVCTGPIR
jgi:hypothetical protein